MGLRARFLMPTRGAVDGVLAYLLRATFDADDQDYADAQVLDTEGEGVQDGQLTVADVGSGTLAIVANECAFTAQGATWGNLGMYSPDGLSKTLGLTLLAKFDYTYSNGDFVVAWVDSADCNPASGGGNRYYIADAHKANRDVYVAWNVAALVVMSAAFLDDNVYEVAEVLGGYDVNGVPYHAGETPADYLYGASYFVRGGAWADYILVWRAAAGNWSPLYPCFANNWAVGTVDNFRVPDADLSAVVEPLAKSTFDAANGTSLDAITPEVGGTWTEENGDWDIQGNRANPDGAAIATDDAGVADVLLSCIINGGSNDNPATVLRYTDGDNYWYLQADRANNNLELHEVNGGADTIRAQDASCTINDSTDYTLVAISDGQDITGFKDSGDRITYASAALNETETAHGIRAEHTDGRFDNFHVHARTAAVYDATFDAY